MRERRGYQTTEFWVTIATNIISIIYVLDKVLPPKYAIFATAIANGIYAISRAIAKVPRSEL